MRHQSRLEVGVRCAHRTRRRTEREREREKEKQEVGVVSFDFEAFIIANEKIMEPTLARCVEFGGSPPPKKGGAF